MTRKLSSAVDRFRQYLAEVTRDRLGRFVRIRALEHAGQAAGVPALDVDQAVSQHVEFLAELRDWLTTDQGTREDLAGVITTFLEALGEDKYAIAEEATRNLENGTGPNLWAELDPGELDVSGLDATASRHLALLLQHWGHRGRVYHWRDGRRELAGARIRVDLANPYIRQLGWAEHVNELAREGHAELSFEDFDNTDWANLYAQHYGERASA